MTRKHLIFSPFAPDLASLPFFVVVQSIANYFLVSLFCRFVMMTNKNPELQILESSENLPR